MKKEVNKKTVKIRLSFVTFLGVVFFVYLLLVGGRKTIENFRLKNSGLCINAIVVDKKNVGSKGVIYTYYQFKVSDRFYENFSTTDDDMAIGDSITIVYLKSNPNVSRSNSMLNINCSSCNRENH
jgi:hypothetical protein